MISVLPGLAWGAGYGESAAGTQTGTETDGDNEHMTVFANYSFGPVTFGVQVSDIDQGSKTGVNEDVDAWGLAFNLNDNLSISYGEREVEYKNPSAANVTEEGEGVALAYTMGSIKIAGNRNEVSNNNNTASSNDEMTEIAVSFAF